ncbi:MAG: 50S ribosomal protein L1 [Phycisphaeraceae bacterium]|nr:50S ribosomal protein L1 [Phycisphaeraceae bacterium]
MPALGKRYRADIQTVEKGKALPLNEAVAKLKGFKKTKFDQSVELCIHLGIDPRQADQLVRGAISLPHGVGATKRVIAFCSSELVEAAKAAGAVEAGGEELVKKIEDGWFDFDVAIASPDMMRVISKLGRVLGPKGLMPSPKAGTVTKDVAEAVTEYAAGKSEFRNDAGGNVRAVVGKHSFEAEKLIGNIQAFYDHIIKIKPSGAKGQYVKKVSLSATMTPGITVAI